MSRISITLYDFEDTPRNHIEMSYKAPLDGSLPKKVSRAITDEMVIATKIAGYVVVKFIPDW
jgi:hypothetical protein